MKVLDNEIRNIINSMKIFIAIDLILKNEEPKNKPNVIKNKIDNNNNLSFIVDNNIHIIDNDITSRNTHDFKDEQKFILQTDSLKSKTPKLVTKPAEKIIAKE